jgi:hypothetical protein
LWRDVHAGYELSAAECEVLRCALEALDRADAAAAIVKADGVTVLDRYGSPKMHPAADVESRNRALFARLVQQLQVRLGGTVAESPVSRRARQAANARWMRHG